MASSPEAQSGSSSSSEDEFDLGGPSLKSEADTAPSSKSADPDKLFSDDSEDDDNTEGDDKKGVTSPKKESPSEKDKEMEDLFGSDYDSEEEEFKASYGGSSL